MASWCHCFLFQVLIKTRPWQLVHHSLRVEALGWQACLVARGPRAARKVAAFCVGEQRHGCGNHGGRGGSVRGRAPSLMADGVEPMEVHSPDREEPMGAYPPQAYLSVLHCSMAAALQECLASTLPSAQPPTLALAGRLSLQSWPSWRLTYNISQQPDIILTAMGCVSPFLPPPPLLTECHEPQRKKMRQPGFCQAAASRVVPQIATKVSGAERGRFFSLEMRRQLLFLPYPNWSHHSLVESGLCSTITSTSDHHRTKAHHHQQQPHWWALFCWAQGSSPLTL